MALVVKTKINFQILDGTITLFNTGDIQNTIQTFTQDFGGAFSVADGVTDMQVCLDGTTQANQIFMLSDKALKVKLVPLGETAATVKAITLYPNLPTLLAVQNLVDLYLTNDTGSDARLIIEGAGA